MSATQSPEPNNPGAVNGGTALRFQVESPRSAVTDAERWTASHTYERHATPIRVKQRRVARIKNGNCSGQPRMDANAREWSGWVKLSFELRFYSDSRLFASIGGFQPE